jgi:stage V sporulation protein B
MSVLRAGIGLLLARLCQPVFMFILFGAAARVLDASTFGTYVLLMSLLALFQTSASLGLVPLFTRELSKNIIHGGKLLGGAAVLLIPASIVSWVAFPFILEAIKASENAVRGGWLLGASLPFISAILVAEGVMLTHSRSRDIVVQNLLENIIRVAASLILLLMGFGLMALLGVFVVTRAGGAFFILVRVFRLPGTAPPRPDWESVRLLASGIPTFGLMAIGAMFFFKVDILAVSTLLGEALVGQYGAAYRLLAITFLLPDSFVAVLFPRMSAACAKAPEKLKEFVPDFARFILAVEIPICAVLAGAAPFIMSLIFGESFYETGPVLAVLAFVLPFHTMNGLLGYLLQSAGKEKTSMILVLTGVALNLGLTWPLTSAFGIKGTAIGTLVATAAVTLGSLFIVHRHLSGLFTPGECWRRVIPYAATALLLLLPFSNHGIKLCPIFAAVILPFVFQEVTIKDFEMVRALFQKRKRD